MFENGAAPSGILSVPPGVSADGIKRMRASFDQRHTGAPNAHRLLFVDKDTQFTAPSANAEESQALESRRFTGEEVARTFQVPPPVVGDLTHGSFTNSETAGRWFAQFCLSPWARRIEAVLYHALFPDGSDLSVELDLTSLQRGSDAERWANWAIALDRNVLSAADVRSVEGWSGPPPSAPDARQKPSKPD